MKKIYVVPFVVLLLVSLVINVFAIYELSCSPKTLSHKDFEKSLQKVIQNLTIYKNADYDYKSIFIMAESGLGLLKNCPEMNSLEEDTNPRLPEGYKLYREKEPGTKTYLNYKGPRIQPDDILKNVDECFGPY